MHLIITLLVLLLVGLPVYAASPLDFESKAPSVDLLSSGDSGMRLVFELEDLQIEPLLLDGEDFVQVGIPGGGIAGGIGKPALPLFSRLIAIPEGGVVEVRSSRIEVETYSNIRLAPVLPDDGSPFLFDNASYTAERLDDPPDVTVTDLGWLRDIRVASIDFSPVQYDPVSQTMNVVKSLEVEIDFHGGASTKNGGSDPVVVPPSFIDLYENLVINYESQLSNATVKPGAILMISVDDAGVLDTLQSLIDWRKRKGAEVIVATTTETGTTKEEIKSYIQGVYDDPAIPLEHVMLIGDAGSGNYLIPTWPEPVAISTGKGDYPYTLLAGSDHLPDVHIGRFSFSNLYELSIMVRKTVSYESEPDITDPTWFTRGFIVGDSSVSGLSVVEASKWLKRELFQSGYTEVDTLWYGSFATEMHNNLNKGTSVFGYRGFGGMSGWSNAYTYTLDNLQKLPFVVALTCETGDFYSGTSISEGFLRAGWLFPERQIGGIGAVCTATPDTHTRFNNCAYYGIFHGLINEGQHTMGAALNRGRYELILNYASAQLLNARVYCYRNNLIGDPAVDVWTAFPEPLTVAHPAYHAVGSNGMTVSVLEGALPCEGAQVCLWKGTECHEAGFTDPFGLIELPASVTSAGDLLLTVTKHNKHPYLVAIPALDTLHVGLVTSAIVDTGLGGNPGNGDGLVNPGELIELSAQLHNYGSQLVSAVTGTLTTRDPFASIVDNGELFGDIAAGADAWNLEDFDLLVDPGAPEGHEIILELEATSPSGSWHSLLSLDLVSAAICDSTVTLYNSGGNGLLDPGETVDVSILLTNEGRGDAANVTGTLVSSTNLLTVSDGTGTFGTISAGMSGENTGDRFTITASPSAYIGYRAHCSLELNYTGGARDTISLSFVFGARSETDPVGPDAYGYLAFDNIDTAYADAPTYNWIELDPAHGGDGVEVVLGDYARYQDKTVLVDLPFTFRYYGQDYDQVSVCSNGWISMGETASISYRNWTIPGAGGPDAILAVYWDKLVQTLAARAFQKWDAVNHRWIFEWSRFNMQGCAAQSETTETFQVLLYDPAYHPTETGDGLIEFQYNNHFSCDAVDGYFTTGIESPDQMDGLLIAYFKLYSEGAAPVERGRAIRFVPKASEGTATAVVVDDPIPALVSGLDCCRPNPFNPITRITYRLAERGMVKLAVYDVAGRLVRSLYDDLARPGVHEATWDGRNDSGADVSSGIYFVRMNTPELSEVRRTVLLR